MQIYVGDKLSLVKRPACTPCVRVQSASSAVGFVHCSLVVERYGCFRTPYTNHSVDLNVNVPKAG